MTTSLKETRYYWYSECEQQGDEHKAIKNKILVSMSNLASAIGDSIFMSVDEYLMYIRGKHKVHSQEALDNMARGVRLEPIARKWYEDNYHVTVKSMGFVVPKWEPRIGGSPDGLVGEDGIIEIKAPKIMYAPLKVYNRAVATGWQPKGFTHVWKTHYVQMQGYLAIMARKWCDYVVYCESENSVFVQRIPFDYKLWQSHIYPRLKYFLDILCGNIKVQLLIVKPPPDMIKHVDDISLIKQEVQSSTEEIKIDVKETCSVAAAPIPTQVIVPQIIKVSC
jgi:hypothetical protein